QQFRVNFNVNEFTLDQQDQRILQQVANKYKASPYAEVTIAAHTDNDADQNYNLNLSKNRANAVKQFLIKSGVKPTHILMSYHGENKPLLTNDNVKNKAENRRVDLHVDNYTFKNVNQMLKSAGGNYNQTFTINPTQPNTIKGQNGTTIFIPANTLVDANNNPVNKPVAVTLSEFLRPKDAMLQSLSTQATDGQQLETGGMFSINAYAENKALKIKNGAALKVVMPSNNIKNDMEMFTGVVNNNGVTEWKSTGKPFVANGVLKVQQYDLKDMRFYFNVPPPPKAPVAPTTPRLCTVLPENKYFNIWKRLTISKEKRAEQYALYKTTLQRNNTIRLSKQKNAFLIYKSKRAKYEADLSNYQSAYSNSFNNWVDQQIKLQQIFLKYVHDNYKDSIGLQNLIAVGADYKVLRKTELDALKQKMHNGRYRQLTDKHAAVLVCLEKMKDIGLVEAHARYGWRDYISCVDFHDNSYLRRSLKMAPALSQVAIAEVNTFAQVAQARNPAAFENELAGLEKELTYTAYIESMGIINCDRFTRTPAGQFVYITIPNVKEAQVAFYIASQKSFLFAAKMANGYQVRIPKNTAYTLFVMSLEKSQPMFYTQTGKAETQQTINASLQPITIAQLKQAFDAL
ncbi:MAG: OmpA family protein, partial [Bacteroidetes bacterium]